jgi:hypothetical protein
MIDADSRSKSMVQTSSVPHNVERHIEQPQSTPRKVLIIDREEDSQEMITALEAEGFRVIQAPDSAAGLRKAAEPDLSLIVVGEQIFVGGEQEAFPPLRAISESPMYCSTPEDKASRTKPSILERRSTSAAPPL